MSCLHLVFALTAGNLNLSNRYHTIPRVSAAKWQRLHFFQATPSDKHPLTDMYFTSKEVNLYRVALVSVFSSGLNLATHTSHEAQDSLVNFHKNGSRDFHRQCVLSVHRFGEYCPFKNICLLIQKHRMSFYLFRYDLISFSSVL